MKLSSKTTKKCLRSAVSVGIITLFTAGPLATSAMTLAQKVTTDNQGSEATSKVKATTKTTTAQEQAPYRNVMYYGDWSVWGGQGNQYPKELPAGSYTHLNFAFLDFNANGDLILTDKDAAFGNPVGSGNTWGDTLSGAIPALAALRKQNPNMKLGISLGGWSKSADFPTVAANPTIRAHFISNVMQFIKYTGMDFVDIDWEFPGIARDADKVDNKNDEGNPNASAADGANYLKLMQDLKAALNQLGTAEDKTYELSVALPGTQKQLQEGGVDLEKLFQTVDFANLMTYDLRGAWDEESGHQTGLYTNPNDPIGYSIDAVVQYLKSRNVEMDKVVIGAAFYTRGWDSVPEGDDSTHPGLFQEAAISSKDADGTPSRGAANEAPLTIGDGGRSSGIWSYRNMAALKAKVPDLTEYWDNIAQAPYLYSKSTGNFFTFDNVRSVQAKADYVKENHLGGMISWMSSEDKDNNGDNVRDELTKAIATELYGSAKLPDVIQDGNEPLNVDVKINVVPTDSGKNGYGFTIDNNEVLEPYAGDALPLADNFYSTIKKAKFIITMKDGSTLAKGDYKAGTVTAQDGKTIVDLSSVYDAKFISPGTEYDFKLATTDGGDVDPDNVKSVELEQFYDSNTLLSAQTIYGSDTPLENQKPVFSGITDETIDLGSVFNLLANVSATDKEDGDLTSKITVSGTVDTNKTGTYELTYTVEDSGGQKISAKRKITVKAANEENAPEFHGVSDKTIFVNDDFDSLAGISATDASGNDITNNITVTGNVDTTKVGKYLLTYQVISASGTQATAQRTITVKAKATDPVDSAAEMVNPKNQVMVGYWHNWASKNDGYKQGTAIAMNLDDVNAAYNVVDVSFMKASGDSSIPTFKPYDQTDEEFRSQVGELNAQGRSVLLALGGADAHIALTEQDKAAFVAEIIRQVDTYGFDGLDIDLEQSAITAAQNQTVIPEALKEVKAHYAKEGKNFLVTMAPEFPYLKAAGSYAAYINALAGQYDWINPQYYNQGGDGVSGENGQWLAQNNDAKKEDFLYYLSTALITGTDGYAAYVQIPANKLVIGLPSNPDAAGSGYVIDPSALSGAMARLTAAGHTIKGLMTWSVNWDNGLNASGQHYNWEFVNRYESLINYDGEIVDENQKPIITGVHDVTITTGDSFDPLSGVSATDYEDGNLTDKIQVTGTVDTNKAGSYKLIYSVEDKEGQKVSKERIVTVQDEAAPSFTGVGDVTLTVGEQFNPLTGVKAIDVNGNDVTAAIEVTSNVDTTKVGSYEVTYSVVSVSGKAVATKTRQVSVKEFTGNEWNADTIYLGGDTVIYNGVEYTAKWWTKGDVPGESDVWSEVSYHSTTAQEYSASRSYQVGDTVIYNGVEYTAKWWTQGDIPGISDIWEAVN